MNSVIIDNVKVLDIFCGVRDELEEIFSFIDVLRLPQVVSLTKLAPETGILKHLY